MRIEAMVVREKDGPFRRETLELDEPRGDEVLVRIIATGMCHTDLAIVHQHFPYRLPAVLGHEGAGVVERVGADVRHLDPGDHVVLSFNSCGHCAACDSDHEAYCPSFGPLNLTGRRPDGSNTLRNGDEPVSGSFFTQSSFASHALANIRNVVRVPREAPLEILGPLGCGVQTGAGAVLNLLRPAAGSTLAVFGAGAVGLSAVMAGKVQGCARIFVVDPVGSRLDLALELGATDVIDPTTEDPVALIQAAGGAAASLDTSGVPASVQAAIQCLTRQGVCGLVSSGKPGATVTLPIGQLTGGRRIIGVMEGDSHPPEFIPFLIELQRQGRLPIEKMIRIYAWDEINQAAEDSQSGVTIKPVIRISAAPVS